MLRAEQGVHRLVRISPTDDKQSGNRVLGWAPPPPLGGEGEAARVLGVWCVCVSRPGGPGATPLDSAVRITHIPTGEVVTCQTNGVSSRTKLLP